MGVQRDGLELLGPEWEGRDLQSDFAGCERENDDQRRCAFERLKFEYLGSAIEGTQLVRYSLRTAVWVTITQQMKGLSLIMRQKTAAQTASYASY